MKRLGFLTGAVVGGLVVFAFNQWRHVSDDDRLTAVLRDHCLPYVQTGETPFQTLGRAPGVYDAVGSNTTLSDGGTRIIYDLRFVAHWGVSSDFDQPVRICEVSPTYSENTVPLFRSNTVELSSRLAKDIPQLETLTLEQAKFGGGQIAFGWQTPENTGMSGLRVTVLANSLGTTSGQVTNVVVSNSIDAE